MGSLGQTKEGDTAGRHRMVGSVLVWLAVAQGIHTLPLGALQGVTWEARTLDDTPGAPRTFSLFYPELPGRPYTTTTTATHTTTSTTTTSTTNTITGPSQLSTVLSSARQPVPVVYLNEEDDLLPQELIDATKNVRPVNVRVIEHEDFIDYEIEFEEYQSENTGSTQTKDREHAATGSSMTFSELLLRARQKHRGESRRGEGRRGSSRQAQGRGRLPSSRIGITSSNRGVLTSAGNVLTTTVSVTTTSPSVTTTKQMSSFHLNNIKSTRNMTPTVKSSIKTAIDGVTTIRNSETTTQSSVTTASINMMTTRTTVNSVTTSVTVTPPSVSVTDPLVTVTRSPVTDESVTGSDNIVSVTLKSQTESDPGVTDPVMISEEIYSESGADIDTNDEIAISTEDILPRHKQQSSRAKLDIFGNMLPMRQKERGKHKMVSNLSSDMRASDVTTTQTPQITTDTVVPNIEITGHTLQSVSSTTQIPRHNTRTSLLIKVTSQTEPMSGLEIETDTKLEQRGNTDTVTETDTHTGRHETQKVSTLVETPRSGHEVEILREGDREEETTVKWNKEHMDLSESQVMVTVHTDTNIHTEEDKQHTPTGTITERTPKRILSKSVREQSVTAENILSGQYHEVNPGQYTEEHPGQYHEKNPGQYHEVNPGQYHEVNPGQVEVDSVKVDFQHRSQDTRSYNVQASAGKFILGEVGRIDLNSGQTLEGVRYTAVKGDVDQERITHILERYFGTRM